MEAFADEYQALKSNRATSPKSRLTKLSPQIDESGIIPLDGRLTNANYLPYDTKYPIILPRGHHVTRLIVKHYHDKANHTRGVNFFLAQLTQRFWIILHGKRSEAGKTNVMSVAFLTVQGRGRQRQKRWLCLFTCLATRATHLEMSWALDSESFLNASTCFVIDMDSRLKLPVIMELIS